ncbi:olfactory guanylyl cyclase GC-D, partial [Biomphalaria glabrata]
VLLLMDLADQLTFLAVASSLAMTRDHAFFTFTKTPYDVTYMSLVGLKADVTSQPQFFNDSSSDKVNIFSSVFVIAPSFPADSSRNSTPVFRRKRHLVEKAIPFPETPSSRQFEKQTTSLKFVSETLRQKRIRTISRTPSGETRPCVNSRSGEKMFNIETDTEHSVISRTFHSELRPTVSSSNSKNSPAYLPSVQTEVKSAFSSFVLARNTAPTQGRHDLDFFSVQSVDLQNKNNNFPPRTTTETLQRNIEAATKAKVDEDADSLIFASEEHIFGNSLLGHRLLASESSFKLRIKRDLESFKPSDLDVKAVYDVVYAVAYSVYKHLETSVTTEIPQGQTLIQAVRNISFSGNSGEFIIDKDASVHYDFIVYDFNEKSKVLERRIFYTATSPFDWTFESMGEISWPEEIILEPDLCFKQLPNCNDGKLY